MKRIVFGLLVACGSKQPAPATVSNTEPAAQSTGSGAQGNARVVQRGAAGGVIELEGDRAVAMEAANEEMISVCGANQYTIVQEGEEAVGMPGPQQGARIVWRVHYQCNR